MSERSENMAAMSSASAKPLSVLPQSPPYRPVHILRLIYQPAEPACMPVLSRLVCSSAGEKLQQAQERRRVMRNAAALPPQPCRAFCRMSRQPRPEAPAMLNVQR